MSEALFERRERPTIMSGRVVTFATGFQAKRGVLGPVDDATGPFEISASRDAVMVHRSELADIRTFEAFRAAIDAAWEAHGQLRAGAYRSPLDADAA